MGSSDSPSRGLPPRPSAAVPPVTVVLGEGVPGGGGYCTGHGEDSDVPVGGLPPRWPELTKSPLTGYWRSVGDG